MLRFALQVLKVVFLLIAFARLDLPRQSSKNYGRLYLL